MNKEYDIDKLVSDIDFTSNSINDFGSGIILTNYEIGVLDKYSINYKNCNSLKEILFYVEEILNDDPSFDDLENISKSIAERDYYANSNK